MRRTVMFLVCTLSASNAFAGGGGEASGEFDPSFLFFMGALILAYVVLYWIPSRIIAGCRNRARRARIAKAWIKELYRDPPPPYRGDDRPPVST